MTATERMPLVGEKDRLDTPGEPWWNHEKGLEWYEAQVDWAASRLRDAPGDRCLVIGSPWPEARRLADNGWTVTYLDCREVPEREERIAVNIGDATALLFSDGQFDAVSSTCVLCHAGLGRYGDEIKANGDALMLAEINRVLRPKGRAALMAGPSVPNLRSSVVYGNVHRIYKAEDVKGMVEDAGFRLLEWSLWTPGGGWRNPTTAPMVTVDDPHHGPAAVYGYLSLYVEKV